MVNPDYVNNKLSEFLNKFKTDVGDIDEIISVNGIKNKLMPKWTSKKVIKNKPANDMITFFVIDEKVLCLIIINFYLVYVLDF